MSNAGLKNSNVNIYLKHEYFLNTKQSDNLDQSNLANRKCYSTNEEIIFLKTVTPSTTYFSSKIVLYCIVHVLILNFYILKSVRFNQFNQENTSIEDLIAGAESKLVKI